jgi:serine/threonine protein kinase
MSGPQGVAVSAEPEKKAKRDALVGHLLAGKYKIIKKIGEGGMGSVYIANQEPIDRKVAVKVLLGKLAEDEIAVKRFEQEAKAISKMQHPNTVTIYDFGKTSEAEDERLYIVMEYLKGKTLTQVLRQDGVLAPHRAARIMRQVCASLQDAHAAGIIHRDLKPDNIFLTEVGGDKDWVKVLDFGVAKLADSEGAGTLTQTGMIFGTPKYMSPEQAEGRPIDYRADIYALGVVLYELLVGGPPFVADTPVGLLLKHISEPPTPFSRIRPDLSIDPRLEAVVMRALDKRPEGRQQMVVELAQALEPFEGRGTSSIQLPLAGTAQVPLAPGMPTEVVPGQHAAGQLTPSGLQPPNQVPNSLSLGMPAEPPTAAASAQLRPADLMPTAAGQLPAQSAQMTSAGLTHPVPAAGGFETLGGVSGEISGRHLPNRGGGKSPAMLYGGVGFLALAAGVVFFAMRATEAPVVTPMTPPPPVVKTETPPPPPPVVKTEPPPPPPVTEPPPPNPNPRVATDRVKPPPPPPPPSGPKKVRLSFESDPERALVSLNGRQIGHTPFFEEFLKEDDVLTFVFSKDGYQRTEKTAVTSRDQTVSAKLDKSAAPPPPPPVAAKKCADGSEPPCRKAPPPPAPPPAGDPTNERVGDLK